MLKKIWIKISTVNLSIRVKLILSFCAIIIVLLLSTGIAVVEYSSMSNYVSGLISGNINSMNMAKKLNEQGIKHNVDILLYLSQDSNNKLNKPKFSQDNLHSNFSTLKNKLLTKNTRFLADSVFFSYIDYLAEATNLESKQKDTTVDVKTWYFNTLQPKFNKLEDDMTKLSSAIYNDLQKNSFRFDRGFYRSIIPGIVAIGVSILLIILLLFFILSYYVNPLSNMLKGLYNFRAFDKKYSVKFEGDDELEEINRRITELSNENTQMSKLIRTLKAKIKKANELQDNS